jgi:sporulation protein YunB
MRVGRRRINWRFIVFALLVFFVFSTVQTFYFLESNLRPTFVKLAEAYSKEVATEAINESIAKKIAEQADYDKLVSLKEGANGKITAGYFNLQEATRVQYQVTEHIQEAVSHLAEKEMSLPMGVALNNSLLAGIGPNVPVKIQPIGHVKSEVGWETRDAGINQTVHVLYLDVHVSISVVVPFSTTPSEFDSKVPIAYLVMVGDVPQMVYNATGQTVKSGSNPSSGSMPPVQLPNLNEGSASVPGNK